jgi:hypothetical protein
VQHPQARYELDELRLAPTAVKGAIALDLAQITLLTTPRDMVAMEVLIDSELYSSGWRLGDVRGLIRHDRKAAADWLTSDVRPERQTKPTKSPAKPRRSSWRSRGMNSPTSTNATGNPLTPDG